MLSIYMISWSWFILSGQAREHDHFWVLYWFVFNYILIFPCLTFTLFRLFVFLGGLCWDTVYISVSLPPDMLADIQQFALSFLQTQPVTVC